MRFGNLLTWLFLFMSVSVTFLSERPFADTALVWTFGSVRFDVVYHVWDLVKTLLAQVALENLVKAICFPVQDREAGPHLFLFDYDWISVFTNNGPLRKNFDYTVAVLISHIISGFLLIAFRCRPCHSIHTWGTVLNLRTILNLTRLALRRNKIAQQAHWITRRLGR